MAQLGAREVGANMIQHDVLPGKLDRCQITGSSDLNLVIDLGHQPPCDSLLTAEMLDRPEKTYPLRLMHCRIRAGAARLRCRRRGDLLSRLSLPERHFEAP
jgi:hypothetical protein